MSTAFWALLLGVAALWPSRLAGPLDGAPLDSRADALVIGLALPLLVAIDRTVLRRTSVRVVIVLLLGWKAAMAATVVQDGWCVRFQSPVPLFVDGERVPHAWDVRADWREDPPRCSAVMTHGYSSIDRFPVWFYNLPPGNFNQPAQEWERPPFVSLEMGVTGSLHARRDGVFRVGLGDDVKMTATIDGVAVDQAALVNGISVGSGTHEVVLSGIMTGDHWVFQPQWNGRDLWRSTTATMTPPRSLDLAIRPWAPWITVVLIVVLMALALWDLSAWAAHRDALALTSVMTLMAAGTYGRGMLMRLMPIALSAAALIRIPARLRNIHGAQLLIGIPFLALIAARGFDEIGLVTWYTSGDDWWMFQRFAYRIYLQGYWFEGGEPAFWFQPFYRWIAGALHMAFGDSSVGELFWDGACALAGALFAFHVTRVVSSFRWGIAAAVLTLALLTGGPAWYLFGRGLSELTSAGLIYAAALWTLRGRWSQKHLVVAGLCAAAAFFTRLNNLPVAAALIGFSLPVRVQAGHLWQWRKWWRRVSKPAFAAMVTAIAGAIVLFSLRTYYYTGSFNALSGTQASARSVWQPTGDGKSAAENVRDSVLMVLTMSDPPKLEPRAIPILAGVAIAILGLAGVAPFRRLPMNVSLLCLAGLVGSFMVRGSAYPGRFSVHLIPVCVALCVSAMAMFFARNRQVRQ